MFVCFAIIDLKLIELTREIQINIQKSRLVGRMAKLPQKYISSSSSRFFSCLTLCNNFNFHYFYFDKERYTNIKK